jgi:hypothetical protein
MVSNNVLFDATQPVDQLCNFLEGYNFDNYLESFAKNLTNYDLNTGIFTIKGHLTDLLIRMQTENLFRKGTFASLLFETTEIDKLTQDRKDLINNLLEFAKDPEFKNKTEKEIQTYVGELLQNNYTEPYLYLSNNEKLQSLIEQFIINPDKIDDAIFDKYFEFIDAIIFDSEGIKKICKTHKTIDSIIKEYPNLRLNLKKGRRVNPNYRPIRRVNPDYRPIIFGFGDEHLFSEEYKNILYNTWSRCTKDCIGEKIMNDLKCGKDEDEEDYENDKFEEYEEEEPQPSAPRILPNKSEIGQSSDPLVDKAADQTMNNALDDYTSQNRTQLSEEAVERLKGRLTPEYSQLLNLFSRRRNGEDPDYEDSSDSSSDSPEEPEPRKGPPTKHEPPKRPKSTPPKGDPTKGELKGDSEFIKFEDPPSKGELEGKSAFIKFEDPPSEEFESKRTRSGPYTEKEEKKNS